MNREFPGGPGVKNLACSAGDKGSIPSGELRPSVSWNLMGQVSLCAAAGECVCPEKRCCRTQPEPDIDENK